MKRLRRISNLLSSARKAHTQKRMGFPIIVIFFVEWNAVVEMSVRQLIQASALFVVLYHLPVTCYVVLILTVGGVPPRRVEGDRLVRRQAPPQAVDVVAKVGRDRVALFVDRKIGVIGDRGADGDHPILLVEVDGIESQRLFSFAVIQAGKIDKTRLQLTDVVGEARGRFRKDHEILAAGQRFDALLEGLDDSAVVVDGDGAGIDQQRRQAFADDSREKSVPSLVLMAVAEQDVVECVSSGMLLVHRVGDRPRLMGTFEVERHHHGSVDIRVIADKDSGLVVKGCFTNGFGFAERQVQKSAHRLIIDVTEFWHVARSFNRICTNIISVSTRKCKGQNA